MSSHTLKTPHDDGKKDSKQKLWTALGWIFLAAAVIGVFLPIVPQVPFAIAAAFCFSEGSPRIHHWLREHEKLGPPIRDWEDHRVVRPKLKAISSVMLLAGGSFAFYLLMEEHPYGAIGLGVGFLAALVFVVTRKSRP